MSTTGAAGWQGQPPKVVVGKVNPESEKYKRMWDMPQYRTVAPGEQLAQMFLDHAKPKKDAEIIDFGCGTGRGGFALYKRGDLRVTMVDFTRNCLDEDVRQAIKDNPDRLKFVLRDLEGPMTGLVAEYGYCTDVLEHIPPKKLDRVINNILHSARHVFFSISCTDDVCGKLIDEPLHLSIHPYEWWMAKFQQFQCKVHYSAGGQNGCVIYCSAWMGGKEIAEAGLPNTELEIRQKNVEFNIKQGWQQAVPHLVNDEIVMILGGGASLPKFLGEIKQMRKEGVKLVTLNGAYNWALEKGLQPSAQFIIDARPFNKRFVQPVVDNCKYFIASQCDPSVFEGLPKDRTYIFHTVTGAYQELLTETYGTWYSCPGGSTVLLRAIPLLRMLGFQKFHLFGCDGCVIDHKHHAYSQPENDKSPIVATIIGGRTFWCSPWMVGQAEEFIEMVRHLGDELQLEIHGDGLLAWILEYAASQYKEGDEEVKLEAKV